MRLGAGSLGRRLRHVAVVLALCLLFFLLYQRSRGIHERQLRPLSSTALPKEPEESQEPQKLAQQEQNTQEELQDETMSIEPENGLFLVKNEFLSFQLRQNPEDLSLHPVSVSSLIKNHENTIVFQDSDDLFQVEMVEGSAITYSSLQMECSVAQRSLLVVQATCKLQGSRLEFDWEATLQPDYQHMIQKLTVVSPIQTTIRSITMFQLSGFKKKAKIHGNVAGSPVVFEEDSMYLSVQHPLARAVVPDGNSLSDPKIIKAFLPLEDLPLLPNQPLEVSFVLGVYEANTLRRSFQHYVERERAMPSRPCFHYNSWYHLRRSEEATEANMAMTEENVQHVIDVFVEELSTKRGVNLSSFLLDDGWDDTSSLWQFNKYFPNGFRKMANYAEKNAKAGLGVWMSPWGGYAAARNNRLRHGKAQGFETNAHGFTLAGPKYFERFLGVCRTMIRDHGVNLFKFDGIGGGIYADGAPPGFTQDIMKLLELTRELRRILRNVYINLTIGTWPSPFWLMYADSIWRGSIDVGWEGDDSLSRRQQWINFRDGVIYRRAVVRGPLFPLNSLMLHGVVVAKIDMAQPLNPANSPPEEVNNDDWDIACEAWTFFATGAHLQEMYINPDLMNSRRWDIVADAARWGQSSAHILRDSHWVGKSVEEGVYGFAAFNDTTFEATLCLRNPKATLQVFEVSLVHHFDIPSHLLPITHICTMRPKFTSNTQQFVDFGNVFNPSEEIRLKDEQPYRFSLPPLAVLVYQGVCTAS
eukprot:m.179273 g.179273  ORF g.179273 m.179273 type:complete len:755 (+) comp25384_c0_seq1:181-2445(+)